MLLYVGGTVFISYIAFSIKTQRLMPVTWNAMFWIILFFAALHSISKSFTQESENRNYYYFYVVKPEAIILSKMIYNFINMLIVSLISFLFFYVVFEIPILNLPLFFLNILLGSLSFSFSLSLISAIASKARNNSSLMAILSVPIIIPVLMMLVKISNHAIDGIQMATVYDEILVLLAINMILITVSYLLFPYLWKS